MKNNADNISGHHSEQYGLKKRGPLSKIPVKGKSLKNYESNPTFRTLPRKTKIMDDISLEVPDMKMPLLVTESGKKSYWFHPQ